jgi:putative ABC transport system permease protein
VAARFHLAETSSKVQTCRRCGEEDRIMRVPLAWHNLTHDRRRFSVRIAGVAFAVFLMFVELAFWTGLLDASAELITRLDGPLVLVSPGRYALMARERFSRRRLAQARGVPGVRDARAVYLEYTAFWKDPARAAEEAPNCHPIRVIAFDPHVPALRLPGVREHADDLQTPGNVLFDTRSRSEFGDPPWGTRNELADQAVRVAGRFTLGTDFTVNGNVLMSDQTYARLFPDPLDPAATLDLVDLGVVQLEAGADPAAVQQALRGRLPKDVVVCTRDEFAEQERRYWRAATPIGFIFGLGLIVGFLVGGMICYQIIATDVGDHRAEFATLKAIGYGDNYLRRVVLHESLWLSVLGFGPGLILGMLLCAYLSVQLGLPLRLTLGRAAGVFGLTAAMCFVSGLLALRKVHAADPAEVF